MLIDSAMDRTYWLIPPGLSDASLLWYWNCNTSGSVFDTTVYSDVRNDDGAYRVHASSDF